MYIRKHIVSYDPQRQRYRVRWTGLSSLSDTYEYVQFLPRQLVKDYRRKKFLPPLANSLWWQFTLNKGGGTHPGWYIIKGLIYILKDI